MDYSVLDTYDYLHPIHIFKNGKKWIILSWILADVTAERYSYFSFIRSNQTIILAST